MGLRWMFGLRGPRTPPSEVVVVSIDHISAKKFGISDGTRIWPRSLHAKLVKKLSRLGAGVVVFDVFFREQRDLHDDKVFADSLSSANNVILFAHLNQVVTEFENFKGEIRHSLMEQLVPPVDLIANSALGYAPFPLPKVPARINQAWLFKTSSGDIPTLPVLALHHYASPVFNQFVQLLNNQALNSKGSKAIPDGHDFSNMNLRQTVREIRQYTLQYRNRLTELQFKPPAERAAPSVSGEFHP